MKNIIVLGDSFTFGHGCSDRVWYYDPVLKTHVGDSSFFQHGPSQYCWASLLQQDYPEYCVINLAKPGADNTTMAMSAHEHINTDTSLIIFSSAVSANRLRVSHPEHNQDVTWILSSTDVSENSEYNNAKKSFLTYLFSKEAFADMSVCALLSIYGLALATNTKFLLSDFRPFKSKKLSLYYNLTEKININHIASITNAKYITPCRHRNDAGHKLYYETIVKPRVLTLLNTEK